MLQFQHSGFFYQLVETENLHKLYYIKTQLYIFILNLTILVESYSSGYENELMKKRLLSDIGAPLI